MSLLSKPLCAALVAAAVVPEAAFSEDNLKLADGAPNNRDSGISELGQWARIFRKRGLNHEILYTNGGGETMQAVISGGVDIGISAGTGAVLGAFAKAPRFEKWWPIIKAASIKWD